MRILGGIKNSSLEWGPGLHPFKRSNRRAKGQKLSEGQGIDGFECIKSLIIIYQTYKHRVFTLTRERHGP